ncbi:MAG: putative sulfate exporter family transporter [Pseudomonadota bacterium]
MRRSNRPPNSASFLLSKRSEALPPTASIAPLWDRAKTLAPGIALAGVLAMAAQFVSDHYGAPTMLMALLFGMAMASLIDDSPTLAAGVGFAAANILKFGVALLGARISVELLLALGWPMVALVVSAIIATFIAGRALAAALGQDRAFATLTAGSVAICGASAALAISAVLPKSKSSDQNLFFTILSVTLLSTIAMVLYPIVLESLGYDDAVTGAFLGATIHDVAQVVGAGFSVSDPAGETATLVKLIRVALLAPVVLILSLLFSQSTRHDDGARPWILPPFVIGFLALATWNSSGLMPIPVSEFLSTLSRAALVLSIAAVGMKTSLKDIRSVGPGASALIIGETLFLAVFVLAGLHIIHL